MSAPTDVPASPVLLVRFQTEVLSSYDLVDGTLNPSSLTLGCSVIRLCNILPPSRQFHTACTHEAIRPLNSSLQKNREMLLFSSSHNDVPHELRRTYPWSQFEAPCVRPKIGKWEKCPKGVPIAVRPKLYQLKVYEYSFRFSHIFSRRGNFVASCLLSWAKKILSLRKKKKILSKNLNYLLSELIPVEKGG